MIRILVADDHVVVRKGIRQIVEEDDGMAVTGEASNGEEALSLFRSGEFDVVILDIAMPGRGGLEIIREMKAEDHSVRIIVLSIYPEEQYAIRSLRDGASAYLTKGCSPEELLLAIRVTASGKRYITPEVVERLASYVESEPHAAPHEALSDRELQVLIRIGHGRQIGEIAAELSLSAKTVSSYKARIITKMGMQTNAQLIRYALSHGLAE